MLVTLDFETYYDKDYSLKKLTTEEYIRDPRFYVHGVGVKVNDLPATYFLDVQVVRVLDRLPWERIYCLCHNGRFDQSILSWQYGIRPKMLLDTLSMARAVFPHESLSLASLSKLCNLGEKGNDLVNFLGRERLTRAEQEQMSVYCRNDVELTYSLFQRLKQGFPASELKIIDQTLRMFTEPTLLLNPTILKCHKHTLEERRKKLLGTYDLTALRSNPQFAKLLQDLGVEPPKKTSLRTKKETWAFAKTDEGMLALLEHENLDVQEVVAARLGVKSSIELTRTEAFLGIAGRGALPIPLNYCGAGNTLRFASGDKLGMQNLPRGGALRKSIVAPPGQVLVVSDFTAIEARVLAWLAKEEALLSDFREGGDVYCSFASKIYGRPITKEADPGPRALAKICVLGLGYGLGWKRFAGVLASGPMGQMPILFGVKDLETMKIPMDATNTEVTTTKLKGEELKAHNSISKYLVDFYRAEYPAIPRYWKLCNRILTAMFSGVHHQFGPISTEKDAIRLPNGLRLQYKGLHDTEDGWAYFGRRNERQRIHGPKLCENIDQALSRIILTDAALQVGERYKVVLTVHDEIVVVVPEGEAMEAMDFVGDCMSVAPAWCADLPVGCEVLNARSYGGAKP